MSSFLRIFAVSFSLAALSALVSSTPSFAAKQANDICKEEELTRMEKDLCNQQIAAAQSKDEQKKVQAKFKSRVDERKAAAEKNKPLSMTYRFTLRVKTRMSSEDLETRLERACQAAYTFSLEGIEERDGDSFKIMMLTFISEADREAFKKGMRGG